MTVQTPDMVAALAAMAKAVFAFTVPAALFFHRARKGPDLTDDSVETMKSRDNPAAPAAKILVIDDDPVILKAASLALEAKRYKVATVMDASAAVTSIHREKPDLILLDLLFPPDNTEGGMAWDGFHILEWLRHMEKSIDTPVIVLTGLEAGKCKSRCLAAGADGFLQKPLNRVELYAAVENALDETQRAKRLFPAVDFEV